MRNDDLIRLKHMLDASKEALTFTGNKTKDAFFSDRKLVLALVKAIEIVGEAANKVSSECKENLSQIPWMSIIGMRNRLIHAYFDIDLDILWST